MLQITIPDAEYWDERKQEFITVKGRTLQLEHSLVSLSKWESKWCKPFFSKEEKTYEETIDYVRCMTITQNVDPEIYTRLTQENVRQINEYIEAPMTATTFSDNKKRGSSQIITSEIVYWWMIMHNIPPEYQKWHLNRLLTLIRVCDIKSQPQKKRSKKDILSQNAALNAARRKQFNTNG